MALRRELDEEVEVDSPGTMSRVGLINDDSTPVGQVHLESCTSTTWNGPPSGPAKMP